MRTRTYNSIREPNHTAQYMKKPTCTTVSLNQITTRVLEHTTELSEPNYNLNKSPVQYYLNQTYFELEPTTLLSETNHIIN